ncbi:unnamed protein product [Ceutorhynchus assimilis]|uniref:DnaJ homolog subfamily C member 21 n=1 Tax=Ceutorhynchus assimilis TaxID=467358 RepID=A0A9N9MHJ2_9CUCU|nr:unnamed protein product [Ceutorhynchus assimilis]
MKCHYEVLGISREADDSEIKSAYRKLALKWHPDKNLDDPDNAKEQFQVVQQAYEVLSDKQERAWYDAHRDQILRGPSSEFENESLDVFQYFTTTCFKGYTDDDKGFYAVYRNVFDQIAKEDIEYMDEKEEFCEIPSFGNSESDNENVKAFYDYWMSYSTKKSYSWLDPYDIREAKGCRRVVKLTDRENKKSRLKARKERNEEVRNLVAFVRKRDRRVQAFKKEMEAKTLENRKKQEQLSKQKRLERKQMHASEKQADWLKFDNVKSELEEIEKHLAQEFGESYSEDEEEENFNNLYCVACNKIFKNPKAFENHEVSKRHKENIEKLKQSMLEEEDVDSNTTEDLDEYNELEEKEENLEDIIDENGALLSNEESIGNDEENLPEVSEKKSSDNDIDSDEEESTSTKKLKKKKKNVLDIPQNHNEDFDIAKVSDDDDFDFGTSKSKKKKSKKVKSKTNNKNDLEETTNEISEEVAIASHMKPKKSAKKEKKVNKKELDPQDLNEIDLSHCCVTCKGNFLSKNKLFDHLKKTGHGVYIPPKIKHNSKKNSLKE